MEGGRSIDVPLEDLPPIDEHWIDVDASAEESWEALFPTLRSAFGGRFAQHFGERVGVTQTEATGDLHHPGGALPGFTVTRAIEPVLLALVGEHNYAKYAIVLKIDLLPRQRSRVRIETRASFEGARGALYKAGVIGTRGHVIVVRRMLRAIKRRAEQAAAAAAKAD